MALTIDIIAHLTEQRDYPGNVNGRNNLFVFNLFSALIHFE